MKTYLVTGGAGFIGSNFVLYMLKKYEDIRIINLDKLTYAGNLENLKSIQNDPRYIFAHGDICDNELVNSLFEKYEIDYVAHFAAESHVDRSIREPEVFAKTNVMGTVNLLNCAKAAWEKEDGTWKEGVKFLHVSTDEVYGSLGELIPLLINNCLVHKDLPVYGDGMNIRDWLFVEDHAKAIDMVINNGRIGEVYNVGGHNERTNITIVKTVIAYLNENVDKAVTENLIKYVEDRKGHDRRYGIDPTKIKDELGWYPETTFEVGIKKTIQWYLDNQEWMKNVTSGEYLNYYNEMYK